jgi:GT2 family glycosyltransferase
LEVLRRQSKPVDEVIVVDNASTDGTGQMIAERFAGDVTYVFLPVNLGGAGGFDKGMRLAFEHGHDWIWCLDSDAMPSETTLEGLLSAECPSEIPIVAKTCVLLDPRTGRLYPSATLRRGKKVEIPRTAWEGKTLPVDNASLCCLLVRADAAQQAGFIEKELFIGSDDYFLSRELKSLGEIVQVGTVVVTHPWMPAGYVIRSGRRRLPAQDYWRTYYNFRNAILFEKRYYSLSKAMAGFTYKYLRSLAATLFLDDYKFYRMRILSKAFCDGLLGRMGKRVEPRDFQNRYMSRPNARGQIP